MRNKYKAWADGKMYYPTDEMWWYFSPTGYYWSLNIGDSPSTIICDSLESENAHLMQYTGLKDRNGQDIYEFDIIKEGGVVSVIEWAVSNARFCYKTETGIVCLYGFYGEVIGNKFENQELLVGGK